MFEVIALGQSFVADVQAKNYWKAARDAVTIEEKLLTLFAPNAPKQSVECSEDCRKDAEKLCKDLDDCCKKVPKGAGGAVVLMLIQMFGPLLANVVRDWLSNK